MTAAALVASTVVYARPALADAYSGLSDSATSAYAAGQGGSLPPSAGREFSPSSVAGTPMAPSATARPTTWPGQPAQYPDTGHPAEPWIGGMRQPLAIASNPAAPAAGAGGQLSAIQPKRCEAAQVLARVGTEVILAGDVIAIFVNEKLDTLDSPIPDEYRDRVLQAVLRRAIEIKMMYLEAKRSIPEENFPNVEKELKDLFYRKAIPEMMKRAKVKTVDELGQKLADLGTSILWQQEIFMERALGQEWMRTKVKFEGEVSPADLLSYYVQHVTDYDHPARARWEELMVSFDKSPSREAAYAKLAQLGNQVKDGMPLAEVARRGSDGVTASEGGKRDWTTRGSLVCKQLDAALFGLPIGQLSPIIESETGLHIVRVVQREDAYRTPFEEVQADIRKTIQDERGMKDAQEYLTRLKDSTPVWTVYDHTLAKKNDQDPTAEPQRR